MGFKDRVKDELRIISIALIVSLLITVPISIILTIINQPVAFIMLIIVVTILIRREIIKAELKIKWHNGRKT